MKLNFHFQRIFDHLIVQIGLLILVVFILLFFIFDNFIMPLYTRQGSERPVPELVGLTLDSASVVATAHGFSVVTETAKYRGTAPEGTVIEQNPLAKSLSKPGRKIHIVPARAMETGIAPDLVGLESRDAQVQCRNYGLICSSTDLRYTFSDYMPKGYVISHFPPSGEQIMAGDAMQLVVSLGPEPEKFIVPSLVELSLHDARQLLMESGLQLGMVTRKPTNAYIAGTVIAQSLRTGERVERGESIDVVVAIPQRESEPPDSESATPDNSNDKSGPY